MHTIELPDAKITRYIPADLSECNSAEYIDMCELIFRYHNQEIDYNQFRVHAVYKLMNLKKGKETQINLTDFAFMNGNDQDAFSKELKSKLDKQLKML